MARVVELVWLDVRESKSLSRRNDIQESDQDGEGRNCSLVYENDRWWQLFGEAEVDESVTYF